MPSVDKSQAKRAGFASTSVLKHEFPSVIHIHALLSKVHFSKHPFSWLTNCDMKTGWRRSGHTVRPLQEGWMVLDGRLDGAREVQTKLMKPLCFSKRLIPQSKESEVIQISERWLWMDHRKGAIKGRTRLRERRDFKLSWFRQGKWLGGWEIAEMDRRATGRGLRFAHFQMFSSTRSSFCTSLHWYSNQSSVLIP